MSEGNRVEFKVELATSARGRRLRLRDESAPPPSLPIGNVARVTRLLALAIHLDGLIRAGEVRDWAEAARVGHVTRARATQIANLLLLAPDIQEQILALTPTVKGRDAVTERDLRPISAEPDWARQREIWTCLRDARGS
jgi:hypothetical protein